MNKRWIALSTVCLGLAAAPFGFDFGRTLLPSVDAQDAVIVTEFASEKDPEKKSKANVITFNVNPLPPTGPLGQVLIGCGVAEGEGGMVHFDAAEIFEGALNLNIPAYKLNQWGTGNLSNGTITLNSDGKNYKIQLMACQAVNTVLEANPIDLSREFVELSTRLANLKLKRTHPQLLALEVETLKKEISDLEAANKLEEAQEQLKKILNEHPESPAAQSAKKMLDGGSAPAIPAAFAPAPTRDLPTY